MTSSEEDQEPFDGSKQSKGKRKMPTSRERKRMCTTKDRELRKRDQSVKESEESESVLKEQELKQSSKKQRKKRTLKERKEKTSEELSEEPEDQLIAKKFLEEAHSITEAGELVTGEQLIVEQVEEQSIVEQPAAGPFPEGQAPDEDDQTSEEDDQDSEESNQDLEKNDQNSEESQEESEEDKDLFKLGGLIIQEGEGSDEEQEDPEEKVAEEEWLYYLEDYESDPEDLIRYDNEEDYYNAVFANPYKTIEEQLQKRRAELIMRGANPEDELIPGEREMEEEAKVFGPQYEEFCENLKKRKESQGTDLPCEGESDASGGEQYEDNGQEYEGDVQQYEGDVQQYEGDVQQYEGVVQEYEGDVQQYEGEVQQYEGDVQQYGGDVQQYGGDVQQYGGDVQQYGGDVQQYGGDVQQYGGDAQQYEEDAQLYEEDAQLHEEDAQLHEEDAQLCEEDAQLCEEDVQQCEEDVQQCEEDVQQCEVDDTYKGEVDIYAGRLGETVVHEEGVVPQDQEMVEFSSEQLYTYVTTEGEIEQPMVVDEYGKVRTVNVSADGQIDSERVKDYYFSFDEHKNVVFFAEYRDEPNAELPELPDQSDPLYHQKLKAMRVKKVYKKEGKLWGEIEDPDTDCQKIYEVENAELFKLVCKKYDDMSPKVEPQRIFVPPAQKTRIPYTTEVPDKINLHTLQMQRFIQDMREAIEEAQKAELDEKKLKERTLPPPPEIPPLYDDCILFKRYPGDITGRNSEESDFVRGIGPPPSNIQDIVLIRLMLKNTLITIFGGVGFRYGKQSAVDFIIDNCQDYLTHLCRAMNNYNLQKALRKGDNFIDTLSATFEQAANYDMATLHDFYQENVVEHHYAVLKQCKKLVDEYKKFSGPEQEAEETFIIDTAQIPGEINFPDENSEDDPSCFVDPSKTNYQTESADSSDEEVRAGHPDFITKAYSATFVADQGKMLAQYKMEKLLHSMTASTEVVGLQSNVIGPSSSTSHDSVAGPSWLSHQAIPGPSRLCGQSIPGPSGFSHQPLPGPSRLPDEPIPGPSWLPDQAIPGPSRLRDQPIPGPSGFSRQSLPGPSWLPDEPMPGPSWLPDQTMLGPSSSTFSEPQAGSSGHIFRPQRLFFPNRPDPFGIYPLKIRPLVQQHLDILRSSVPPHPDQPGPGTSSSMFVELTTEPPGLSQAQLFEGPSGSVPVQSRLGPPGSFLIPSGPITVQSEADSALSETESDLKQKPRTLRSSPKKQMLKSPETSSRKQKSEASPRKQKSETSPKKQKSETSPRKQKSETSPRKQKSETSPRKQMSETSPRKQKSETSPRKQKSETSPRKQKSETSPRKKHDRSKSSPKKTRHEKEEMSSKELKLPPLKSPVKEDLPETSKHSKKGKRKKSKKNLKSKDIDMEISEAESSEEISPESSLTTVHAEPGSFKMLFRKEPVTKPPHDPEKTHPTDFQ